MSHSLPLDDTSQPATHDPVIEGREGGRPGQSLWLGGLTGLLWLAVVGIAGPLAWKGLLVTGAGLGWRRHRRRHPLVALAVAPLLTAPPRGDAFVLPRPVSRQELASSFGLEERMLFRARQARICDVSHDAGGAIVAIRSLPLAPDLPKLLPHAHPVG